MAVYRAVEFPSEDERGPYIVQRAGLRWKMDQSVFFGVSLMK